MAKRLIATFDGRPLLDIASYGRGGPERRDRLSPEDIALVSRTVSRAPEVVVKVLTRGGQSMKAVRAHLAYLNRGGELEIETDQGERLAGENVENDLLETWDLDVDELRRRDELQPRKDGRPPKLVHKILFSMPPGTAAEKVLAAVKNFAREEFGLRHRYAMVLHTDEPHPHIHMVVKAMSERGDRMNVRKATLRRWRAGFAEQLRKLGVPANATERAVRGANRPRWHDGVYRADLRGGSTVVHKREAYLSLDLSEGYVEPEKGKSKLLSTRRNVERGWHALAARMTEDGMPEIADQVRRFTEQMPATRTDAEWLARRILARSREPDAPTR